MTDRRPARRCVGPAVQAALRQEFATLVDALATGRRVHEDVHAARKSIRRLRALLALLEDTGLELGPCDQHLRELGDGLSALRDAHVVVATARSLSGKDAGLPWGELVEVLRARRASLLEASLAEDPGFQQRRQRVVGTAAAIDALSWDQVKRKHLRAALRRSQRRLTKAARRSDQSSDPEAAHRWRRKARRLRMQLEWMAGLGIPCETTVGGGATGGDAKALHRLSNRLGRQQDLQVLADTLEAMPELADQPVLLESLHKRLSA